MTEILGLLFDYIAFILLITFAVYAFIIFKIHKHTFWIWLGFTFIGVSLASVDCFFTTFGIPSSPILVEVLIPSLLASIFFLIAARKMMATITPSVAAGGKEETMLLRDDIFAVRAYASLTNTFLTTAKPALGAKVVDDTLNRWAEEHPVLFEDSQEEGKINASVVIKNLDRIYEKNKLPTVRKELFPLISNIIKVYSAVTSPERAKIVFEQVFRDYIKLYGEEIYSYGLPFILFKEILEPILMKCGEKTIADVSNKIEGMNESIIKGMEIDKHGKINIEKIYEDLSSLSVEDYINRLIYAFSRVMNICYPIMKANIGDKKVEKTCSGAFEDVLRNHSRFLSRYKISDAVPNGVNVPMMKLLLEPGKIYLKEEEEPVHAFKTFSALIEHGHPGMCITKNYPEDVTNKYSLKKISIIWFTPTKHRDVKCISSEESHRIINVTKDFVANNDDGVIFLDCVPRLIMLTGYADTLSLLNRMVTIIKPSNFRIIVSVNPQTLDESERYSLSKITTKM